MTSSPPYDNDDETPTRPRHNALEYRPGTAEDNAETSAYLASRERMGLHVVAGEADVLAVELLGREIESALQPLDEPGIATVHPPIWRVVDPTGTFFVSAGQYQPDAATVNVSLRPENLTTVDEATRERWVSETAALYACPECGQPVEAVPNERELGNSTTRTSGFLKKDGSEKTYAAIETCYRLNGTSVSESIAED